MGNSLASETESGVDMDLHAGANLPDLRGKFPMHLHLRPDSDSVALLVPEHQCEVHNIIHRTTLDYLRALWVAEQPRPGEDHELAGGCVCQTAVQLIW